MYIYWIRPRTAPTNRPIDLSWMLLFWLCHLSHFSSPLPPLAREGERKWRNSSSASPFCPSSSLLRWLKEWKRGYNSHFELRQTFLFFSSLSSSLFFPCEQMDRGFHAETLTKKEGEKWTERKWERVRIRKEQSGRGICVCVCGCVYFCGQRVYFCCSRRLILKYWLLFYWSKTSICICHIT